MKSVIVLGNARSGTSMTAGLLSILGVEMHQTKKNPQDNKVPSQNPKGSFENVNFAVLTSKMHQDYVKGESMKAIKEKYAERFQQMCAAHEKPLWGFKSAVTHHFLPIMLPLINKPHIVVVVRSLLDNARSWQLHMKQVYGRNVSMHDALQNMSHSQHVLMRNALNAQCPKLFTSYEGIRAKPLEEAERMAKFLEVDIEPKKRTILDFIMPNYSTLNPS
jgi:hypothetical protein